MKLPTFFANKKNIYLSIGILVVIIILLYYIFSSSTSKSFPLTVKKENFVNTVSITGKAIFDNRSDLGFDKSGRISAIYKNVGDKVGKGDIIASIDNKDINAELALKQAAVDRERAKLDSALVGTRPEQLKIYDQTYKDASSALLNAARSSYLTTENALLQQVDTVFSNGASVNPTINIHTDSDTIKKEIEKQRLVTQESMTKWNSIISTFSDNSTDTDLSSLKTQSSQSLAIAKTFSENLGKIVVGINTGNSGQTQNEIDTIRANINSAGQYISSASNAYQTAETAYNNAKDNLALAQSGSTSYDIEAQKASLRSAEADLDSSRAKFSQTTISSPFDGIVTRVDTKIGEIVSPTDSPVTTVDTSSLIIEAYIPEININQVKVGDLAKITFDAFGSDTIFSGSVTSIDLAETVRDGVATYKIKVKIDAPTENIRSGMTSDVVITTGKKDSIITIPRGYLIKEGSSYYVYVGDKESSATKKQIEIGDIGSMSTVEVVSGLNDGDKILSPIVQLQ